MRLPQPRLEHLAGCGQRERVDYFHRARALVWRDQRLAVLAQLLARRGHAWLEHDDGMNALAPRVVGNAEDRARRNGWVLRDRLLHFRRIHVLAAGDDHVLDAIDDEHEAI